MDPNAVAQQFITAYGTFLTSGNVAGMSALYGADSTVIYDGTIARGQGAITSTFVAPRLAGGVKMRLSGHSVQGTATGHLLISMDGEFDKPPGHFHVVILLGPTPAGGMYIKAELGRCVGAAARQGRSSASVCVCVCVCVCGLCVCARVCVEGWREGPALL